MIDRRAFVLALISAASGCASKPGATATPVNPSAALRSSFAAIDRRIRKHVADKSKHAPLEALAEAAREQLESVDTILRRWRYRLAQLSPEQRRDRATLFAYSRAANGEIRDALVSACERAVEARAYMTPSEWALVFPTPSLQSTGMTSTEASEAAG